MIEWMVIGCLGVVVVLLSSVGRMSASADQLVYERLNVVVQRLPPGIVVIAPDNAGASRADRSPWSRDIHAAPVEQIGGTPGAVTYAAPLVDKSIKFAGLLRASALRVISSGELIRTTKRRVGDVVVARQWVLFSASLIPLAMLLSGFLVWSSRRLLLLTGTLSAFAMIGSVELLCHARFWMSPVPAITALVVVYPIWNWRCLEITRAYLCEELRRFADDAYFVPSTTKPHLEDGGDVLEQYAALMAQAAQHVQNMKRLVWDSMPGPTLVCNVHGIVLIANDAAKAHLARLGTPRPEMRLIKDVLAGLTFVKMIGANAASEADRELLARMQWPALLDPTRREFAALMTQGVEVRDADGQDALLRYTNWTNAQGEVTGWIASLVDVSALRAAKRQREDALRLLSRDMRSPQVAILALIEMERSRNELPSAQYLLNRIERYVQRSLTLADDFVQLAHAESQAYVLEPVSLKELVIHASDEVLPQAQAKRISLEMQTDDDGADADVLAGADEGGWVCVDRSLTTRALVNILNNAIKYSPSDTRILCRVGSGSAEAVSGTADRVVCTICDQGYGFPGQQVDLFERFRRFHVTERPEVSGTGLGMGFVKTVVTRHGGNVEVVSVPGKGTAFTIYLPALQAAHSARPAVIAGMSRHRKVEKLPQSSLAV